jgi:hypothetical protein
LVGSAVVLTVAVGSTIVGAAAIDVSKFIKVNARRPSSWVDELSKKSWPTTTAFPPEPLNLWSHTCTKVSRKESEGRSVEECVWERKWVRMSFPVEALKKVVA